MSAPIGLRSGLETETGVARPHCGFHSNPGDFHSPLFEHHAPLLPETPCRTPHGPGFPGASPGRPSPAILPQHHLGATLRSKPAPPRPGTFVPSCFKSPFSPAQNLPPSPIRDRISGIEPGQIRYCSKAHTLQPAGVSPVRAAGFVGG